MALVKCKECGEQVSTKAKACPKCGAKPPRKTTRAAWMALFLVVLVVSKSCYDEATITPEQAAARAVKRAEEQRIAEAEAAERRKRDEENERVRRFNGLHCLMGGTHPIVERFVISQMRDPKSFEHIETRTSQLQNGKHQLRMMYRAANGYGGMSVGVAKAVIDHESCEASILSIE